jgi:hypothetical protein
MQQYTTTHHINIFQEKKTNLSFSNGAQPKLMLQIGQQHTSLFMNSSDMRFLQTDDGIYIINGRGALMIHEE